MGTLKFIEIFQIVHCFYLQGEEKKKETFFRAARAIWRVFHQKFGSVRVDFGQPFSLQVSSNSVSLEYYYVALVYDEDFSFQP